MDCKLSVFYKKKKKTALLRCKIFKFPENKRKKLIEIFEIPIVTRFEVIIIFPVTRICLYFCGRTDYYHYLRVSFSTNRTDRVETHLIASNIFF